MKSLGWSYALQRFLKQRQTRGRLESFSLVLMPAGSGRCPQCDPPAVRGVLLAAPHDGIVPGRLGRGGHDAVIAISQGLLGTRKQGVSERLSG